MTPNSPCAVMGALATTTSCAERPSPGSGASVSVRATRPLPLSSTQHGSSGTSSGAFAVVGAPEEASSTVRRGVPNSLATWVSSSPTRRRSTSSLSMMSRSRAISSASSPASFSNSMVE